VANGAERPTAEQVEAAIALSVAQYAEQNPPPTRDEHLDDLKNSLREKVTERNAVKNEQSRVKKNVPDSMARESELTRLSEWQSRVEGEIDSLKVSIKNIDPYKPPEPTRRLMPMEWGGEIGTVGHVGIEIRDGVKSGRVQCTDIITNNEFVGRYKYVVTGLRRREFNGQITYSTQREEVSSDLTLFVGIPTNDWDEGTFHELDFDGVVTGTHTFRTVAGKEITVPVIEVLTRDVPFK